MLKKTKESSECHWSLECSCTSYNALIEIFGTCTLIGDASEFYRKRMSILINCAWYSFNDTYRIDTSCLLQKRYWMHLTQIMTIILIYQFGQAKIYFSKTVYPWRIDSGAINYYESKNTPNLIFRLVVSRRASKSFSFIIIGK